MTDGKNSLRVSSWGGGVKVGYLCPLEHWENVVLTDFRAPHIPVLCPGGQKAHLDLYRSPLSPAGFLSPGPNLFHPLLSAQHPASSLTEQGSVSRQREATSIFPKPETGPTRAQETDQKPQRAALVRLWREAFQESDLEGYRVGGLPPPVLGCG